ncbi:hypothetical protein ABBQ32_010096 [Trebouxia sp. C0010 RCD-2024]
MSDWAEDQDPYEILGLAQGHESTEAQIKKAYRQLALKKHPDKQPNNPNAAAEFHPIQRAFDLLSDEKARAALDDLYKAKAARKAREAGQTEKRRKMREDLEKRESTWQTARNDEQKARNKLKEELDRLRRQAAERRASHAAEVSLAFAQATAQPPQSTDYHNPAAPSEYQPEAPPYMTEELLRTLKVSWDKQNSSMTYSIDDLRQIMSKHGPVEDVVLQESKKRKKGSALIVMQDLQSARAASEAVNGSLSNPLLVVPFAKAAARAGADSSAPPQAEQAPSPEAYMPAEPRQQPQEEPAFPLSSPATTPTPPSSPVKVRNPFGGGAAVDQSGMAPLLPQARMPTFGMPAGPASSGIGFGHGASMPAAKPLFAAGASMGSIAAGPVPAGPFGFNSSSYSSFPGVQNGSAGQLPSFGQSHFGPSVQAGVKRAFEDATLLKLKQAADRAREIQQLRTEDAEQ